MHGRGPKADAPASDAAGRGDAAGTPQTARPCRVGPRRAMWQVPNRADAAEVGADSAEIGADVAEIGPTRSVSACIGRNGRVRPKFQKKKKKKGRSDRLTWCRDFFIKNVWCRLSFGKGKPWGNK